MDIGIVSSRYAKALLKFATAHKQTDEVFKAMTVLKESFSKVPRLKTVLANPVLSADEIYRLLSLASGKSECSCLQDFFRLVIKNRRVGLMPFIANSYIEAYRAERNMILCELTVPAELDAAVVERIKAVVEGKTHKQVDFSLHIDPSIIGGFIIEYDSQRLDASVAGRLRELRKQIA